MLNQRHLYYLLTPLLVLFITRGEAQAQHQNDTSLLAILANELNEAQARQLSIGLEQLGQEFQLRMGKPLQSEKFEDAKLLTSAVESGRIDFGLLSAIDYELHVRATGAQPLFIITSASDGHDHFSLLVPKSSTIQNPTGLAGKTIHLFQQGYNPVVKMWIESVTGGNDESLHILRTKSAKESLYPVFFEQAEACVVPTSALEILTEMNPQIPKRAREIARSPSLPMMVVFAHQLTTEAEHKLFLKTGMDFATSKKGQQILALAHLGKVQPYDDQFMLGIRALADQTREKNRLPTHKIRTSRPPPR